MLHEIGIEEGLLSAGTLLLNCTCTLAYSQLYDVTVIEIKWHMPFGSENEWHTAAFVSLPFTASGSYVHVNHVRELNLFNYHSWGTIIFLLLYSKKNSSTLVIEQVQDTLSDSQEHRCRLI